MRTRDGGTRDGASTTGRPGRLQWTDTALVEAPAERVWELLISTIGDTAVDDRHVRIDRSARRLVVEGDWWFRGVYSVEPHERGTLVVCRVYDIARTARLLVPVNNLFNRTRQTHRAAFDQMIGLLGARLRCAAHPMPAEGRG